MEAKWKRRRRNGRRKRRAILGFDGGGSRRGVAGKRRGPGEGVGGRLLGSESVSSASESIARPFPAIIVWASVPGERGNKERLDENMIKK